MRFINVLILSILLLFISHAAKAQFANNNKEQRSFILAVGGGGAIFDGAYSMIGGDLMFEVRKPIAIIGKNFSLSTNLSVSMAFGNRTINKVEKFASIPTGMLTLNLNAFSQATKVNKNLLGVFLGAGLLFLPKKEVSKTDRFTNTTIVQTTGMVGPAVVFGPRFRLGSSFLDLRLYGGITMGEAELTYGGINIMFTLGMGQKKRRLMR